VELFDEKTNTQKSHDTVPLSILPLIQIHKLRQTYFFIVTEPIEEIINRQLRLHTSVVKAKRKSPEVIFLV